MAGLRRGWYWPDYTPSSRGGTCTGDWSPKSLGDGCVLLGPVSADQLRILYQHALALVFPSLYEGFGLPPARGDGGGHIGHRHALLLGSRGRWRRRVLPRRSLGERSGPGHAAIGMRSAPSRAGLRARGRARVEQFSWERTARETLEVYRSAVFQPSARSLAMRRRLREAILTWSDSVLLQPTSSQSSYRRVTAMEPLGIRTAWKALNLALHNRLRREMDRISLGQRRGRPEIQRDSQRKREFSIGTLRHGKVAKPLLRDARCRLIAFHLPQFHPIAENDRWWGKGFTEWTNVAKARPLFRGHDQPRLPADLGYYDLRLPEARASQAELARSYGIEGFCYWHYWFHGHRLLERPVNEMLSSGEPNFPFCLAWANESWSRSWLGDNREVLVEQTYSDEDDRTHARWLARACADPRYIRVHGRPMVVVYKPIALPDSRRTTDIFRSEFIRLGLPEPYLVGINAHRPLSDMRELGFDMTEHHEPQLGVLGPDAFNDAPLRTKFRRNLLQGIMSPSLKVYSYAKATTLMARLRPKFPHFPCCFVGWDNTARRGRHAIVMVGSTPELFRGSLHSWSRASCTEPERNESSSSTPGMSGLRGCTWSRTRSSAINTSMRWRPCSINSACPKRRKHRQIIL